MALLFYLTGLLSHNPLRGAELATNSSALRAAVNNLLAACKDTRLSSRHRVGVRGVADTHEAVRVRHGRLPDLAALSGKRGRAVPAPRSRTTRRRPVGVALRATSRKGSLRGVEAYNEISRCRHLPGSSALRRLVRPGALPAALQLASVAAMACGRTPSTGTRLPHHRPRVPTPSMRLVFELIDITSRKTKRSPSPSSSSG